MRSYHLPKNPISIFLVILLSSSNTFRYEQTPAGFPELDFPTPYLSILSENGFTVDSSVGRHKKGTFFVPPHRAGGLARLPASTPPSLLRVPPILGSVCDFLSDPVVLFFHPWEFVDVTRRPIPIDCRFRTGEPAIDSLRSVIRHFRRRQATFYRMTSLASEVLPA